LGLFAAIVREIATKRRLGTIMKHTVHKALWNSIELQCIERDVGQAASFFGLQGFGTLLVSVSCKPALFDSCFFLTVCQQKGLLSETLKAVETNLQLLWGRNCQPRTLTQ
jgi:hypothetical protein